MQSSKQSASNDSNSTITNSTSNIGSSNNHNSNSLLDQPHQNLNRNLINNTNSSNTSSTSSLTRKTTKWVKLFCSSEKNQFLCKVDVDYMLDGFNLIGLEDKVIHYRKALAMILDKESHHDSSTSDDYSSDDCREIEILSSAETLYGLIHARFILTDAGLQRMLSKYQKRRFGTCIRYYCERSPMLPIGLKDLPGFDSVRLYCPRCKDIYVPHFSSKSVSLDGAYFGTSFPHMFFMVYPYCRPPLPTQSYVARLYGFQIHENAYEFQGREYARPETLRNVFCKTTSTATNSQAGMQLTTSSPASTSSPRGALASMNGAAMDREENLQMD